MNSNIYRDTYLQLISNSNKINRIKHLILENKNKLSNRINNLLFTIINKNNLIFEEIDDSKKNTLNNLINTLNNLTDISNESLKKLENIILNIPYEDSLKSIIKNNIFLYDQNNSRINTFNEKIDLIKSIKNINDKNDENDQKIYNYIFKYLNDARNIRKFLFDFLKEKNNFTDTKKRVTINIQIPYIIENIWQIINGKSAISLDELTKAVNDFFNSDDFKSNAEKSFFNNNKEKFNNILNTFLVDMDQNIISIFYNYYQQLLSLTQDKINIILNRSDDNKFLSFYELYRIVMNNDNNDDNNDDANLFITFCNIVYNIKSDTSASGGKGEVLLSLILPKSYKASTKGDIFIDRNKAEIKGLFNKTKALINGNNKQSIDKTKNKEFILYIFYNLLNPIKQIYDLKVDIEKISLNDEFTGFLDKQLIKNLKNNKDKLISFLDKQYFVEKNEILELFKILDKKEENKIVIDEILSKFNILLNTENLFYILLNNFYNFRNNIIVPNTSITLIDNFINSINDIKNTLNQSNLDRSESAQSIACNQFCKKLPDLKEKIVNFKKIDPVFIFQEAFSQLLNNRNIDTLIITKLINLLLDNTPEGRQKANNYLGCIILQYYILNENSTYFICCINNNKNNPGIDIFNCKPNGQFIKTDYFQKNYLFDTPRFEDGKAITPKIKHI